MQVGDIGVGGTLSLKNSAPAPIARANEVFGGFMQVADDAARNAIPSWLRTEGLTVYVVGDTKTWQLQGGVGNGNWVEFGGAIGAAGGDLAGTYPNPTLAQHAATPGQVLAWNGAAWLPATLATQDLSATLGYGNTTGAHDIVVTGGQKIVGAAGSDTTLMSPNAQNLHLNSNGSASNGWFVDPSGHLLAELLSSSQNIGTSGGSASGKPNNLYLAGSVTTIGGGLNHFAGAIKTDGLVSLAHEIDFGGGTTSFIHETVDGLLYFSNNAGNFMCVGVGFGNDAGHPGLTFDGTASTLNLTTAAGTNGCDVNMPGKGATHGERFTISSVSGVYVLNLAGTSTPGPTIPAKSIVLATVTRVIAGITTAVNYEVLDNAGTNTLLAVTTAIAAGNVGADGPSGSTGHASYYATANTTQIVTNVIPAAGSVEVTIFFVTLTPPTS